MTQIIDVGPAWSNINASVDRSVIGRMLSVACSPDGQAVYVGSYSNLWASYDGGQNFQQLTWPQPAPDQFDVPGSLGGGWCAVDMAVASGWRVDKHPRFLARLTRRGHEDIVGFGDCGVWTALGNGDGSFQQPNVVIANLGYNAGGWRVDKHPRFVVDLNGDGFADIVGFGDAGVWTALGNGDGTFQDPKYVLDNFGYDAGGWRVEKHPRFLAKLTNSGFADIVGFGDAGVWTALGNGDGTFQQAKFVLANFGYDAGGWRVEKHPRFLANLTSSGFADIVGFGDAGVWTALGNGDGSFQEGKFVLANFGYDAGGWRVDEHPRYLANLTSSGFADIVGFGYAGVWTAVGNGDGSFQEGKFVLANLGYQQGWRVDRHPRLVASLASTNPAEIVGFGDAGVWSSIGDGQGGFPTSNFVLANFGYQEIVLAFMCLDLVDGAAGIWRSSDGGASWIKVYEFGSSPLTGQIQWAPGSDHLVCAVAGDAIFISRNAGATFQEALEFGGFGNVITSVNHIAVWQNSPAESATAVIYALGQAYDNHVVSNSMFVSRDGGATWMEDNALPSNLGNVAGQVANANAPSVMVISPSSPNDVYVAGNANAPPVLWHGVYSFFPPGTIQSTWQQVHLPQSLIHESQDSGNVFLAVTQRDRGDLLFYGAQRNPAFVGKLNPASDSDWQALAPVHVDLHGILLSPDFAAAIKGGVYQPGTGTVWILSDGGISWSTDGGKTFHPAHNVNTLSCVDVAGVSNRGSGPAFSLNTGDNDGFYSMDGGANWSYQQYGGGDNDCAFADPLRSYTMLIFTPRWNHTVTIYEASPGDLPNASVSGTSTKHTVPGPATPNVWNANSAFGNRGSRPIVLGLPGEGTPAQGDYIFVLNPSSTAPQLVRTQNAYNIASSNEWMTTATGPGQGSNVFRQGPPLPTPNPSASMSFPSLGIVQASGGHGNTVFYIGGDGSLWTWTQGAATWTNLVSGKSLPAAEANYAFRFFVDPYRPNLIYILDLDHVKRSDDGGSTWVVDQLLEAQLTWGNQIQMFSNADTLSGIGDYFDVVLTDMKFDPYNPLVRFAVGQGGAFYTNDGVNWIRLLHAGAIAGRPANCYYDWITNPDDPALYVSFAGRSLMKISQLPQSTII